jgi:hypothetical protein
MTRVVSFGLKLGENLANELAFVKLARSDGADITGNRGFGIVIGSGAVTNHGTSRGSRAVSRMTFQCT